MTQSCRSLYEKDIIRSNRIRLMAKLTILLMIVVFVPSVLVLINLTSWVISLLVWTILTAITLMSLFTALLNEGFRELWASPLSITEPLLNITDSLLQAYVYVMPIVAGVALFFGIISIVFGMKNRDLPGAATSVGLSSSAIGFAVMGVIIYYVIMFLGYSGGAA